MVEHFMVIGLYHTQHNKRVKCVAAKVAKGNWRNVLQQESTHKKKKEHLEIKIIFNFTYPSISESKPTRPASIHNYSQ